MDNHKEPRVTEQALFIARQREKDSIPAYIDDATIMKGEITQHEWAGWQDRAALTRQAAPEAPTDGIRGPLTPHQRDHARCLYSNLYHLGKDAMEDVVRYASVCGYVNGRLDFAPDEGNTAPATQQAGAAVDSRMVALEAANAQVAEAARRREERSERLGIPAATTASAIDRKGGDA